MERVMKLENMTLEKFNLRNTNRLRKATPRSYRSKYSKIIYFAVIAIFVVIFTFFLFNNKVIANSQVNTSSNIHETYYTSINIKNGDTLWEIAEQFVNDPSEINSYVDNLKKINNLTNDIICQGQHLIVYYHK